MYKASYRCKDCNHNFSRVTKNFPKKEPNCPKCKKNDRLKWGGTVSDTTHDMSPTVMQGGTPDNPQKTFSMGKSNFTKAMDTTAEIVMQDYNLTNLQDNLRAGDSMAPKLTPELERKVDDVFKPQKPIMGQQGATNLNKAITANINAGRYAGQTKIRDVAAQAADFGKARESATGNKVPTQIIHDYDNRGKPN